MNIYLQDPYYFSKAIASLVLFAQAAGIAAILALLVPACRRGKYIRFLRQYSLGFALTVAIVAVASSLIYSEVFDMRPCKLCWFARIFIFPQVILLGIAYLKKQGDMMIPYVLTLAFIALPISIFHYCLQMIDAPAVLSFAPCDVTGQAPSCSSFYVHIYGYITIPLMSVTTSSLIALLMLIRKYVR